MRDMVEELMAAQGVDARSEATKIVNETFAHMLELGQVSR